MVMGLMMTIPITVIMVMMIAVAMILDDHAVVADMMMIVIVAAKRGADTQEQRNEQSQADKPAHFVSLFWRGSGGRFHPFIEVP